MADAKVLFTGLNWGPDADPTLPTDDTARVPVADGLDDRTVVSQAAHALVRKWGKTPLSVTDFHITR